ncbi:MAG: response regulator transcription factor [Chloroflexota bacterium]|nr:MAG: response regulator transcription factor [Chloroflexota bacterium]
MARVLVIDDDPEIVSLLRRGLSYEGYSLVMAENGEEALEKLRAEPVDLVVLDLMLPGIDGIEVCRRLRRISDVPVLMLTAKRTVPDKVAGFDSGADDYLVKPFAFDELLVRLKALLRRRPPGDTAPANLLRFADLVVDPSGRRVWRRDQEIELTAREFDLLELFMRHPHQVLRREVIHERVWGYDFEGESNIIDVYVRYLRTKLEAVGGNQLIQTVRGVGYVLRES